MRLEINTLKCFPPFIIRDHSLIMAWGSEDQRVGRKFWGIKMGGLIFSTIDYPDFYTEFSYLFKITVQTLGQAYSESHFVRVIHRKKIYAFLHLICRPLYQVLTNEQSLRDGFCLPMPPKIRLRQYPALTCCVYIRNVIKC